MLRRAGGRTEFFERHPDIGQSDDEIHASFGAVQPDVTPGRPLQQRVDASMGNPRLDESSSEPTLPRLVEVTQRYATTTGILRHNANSHCRRWCGAQRDV